MNLTLFTVGVAVGPACLGSAVLFWKDKTVWKLLELSGASCLVVVVLTHLAEALHVFPSMGWGMPNSVGHYVDLVSAVLGLTLLLLGLSANSLLRRKNSN